MSTTLLAEYDAFLRAKRIIASRSGVTVSKDQLHPRAFPFQRDLTAWALNKGVAALFADAGLGKTLMELDWARHAAEATNGRALGLAPLAVSQQTLEFGRDFDIPLTYARCQAEAADRGITITNYEMLHHFDASQFGAVFLDESSILKAFSGTTKRKLVEAFRDTPMKLCGSATPAPNDIVELTNHAEFLGVMSPADMLSTFFISKGQDQKSNRFRLKNHARSAFFRFLASWAMALKRPSDLGYSDEGYVLPKLHIHPVRTASDYCPPDRLIFDRLRGVTDRTQVRRGTIAERVRQAVEVIASEPSEPWLIWCGMNDESTSMVQALTAAGLPAVEVHGAQSVEFKAQSLADFAAGRNQILVTKPSIAGYGMNFQSSARQYFCGIGDSYEDYYQCIRRQWRFGQKREVHAYVGYTDAEEDVYANVLRKEQEAESLSRELLECVREFELTELRPNAQPSDVFTPTAAIQIPTWLQESTYAA